MGLAAALKDSENKTLSAYGVPGKWPLEPHEMPVCVHWTVTV